MTGSAPATRDERRQQMLGDMVLQAGSMFGAHALFAAGADDAAATVERVVTESFGSPSAGAFVIAQMGCFDTFAAMFLYCRWYDELTPATRQHIEHVMSRDVHGRGNTENHWLMHYTAQLLATERFGEMETWWNGRPPAQMHAEADRWIRGTIERTVRVGHHEYDSTHYHSWHVLPMIALADHARDEGLRARAADMATLFVADMALEYFKGVWAGGHAREGYRENTWEAPGGTATLLYYYFGGPTYGPRQHQSGMAAALTSTWQPPGMLEAIANDREQPRTVRKTKAPRTIYRHVERDATPVRKTTYTSRSFALGTSQLGLPGAPAAPIDLLSWDLTWAGPDHEATIVSCHPYDDPGRFSAFLSDLPQDIGRGVPAAKPFLQFADRLSGASPYERMMQHEATAILLYRIPADDSRPWVNLYLPDSTTWHQQGPVLVGDTGSFYVRLELIGNERWDFVKDAHYIDGWYVRLRGHDVGLIVEASETDGWDGFEAFLEAAAEPRAGRGGWPADGRVTYGSLAGAQLDMTWDGEHRVDGQAIDYGAWPLYDAPEAQAPMNSGVVELRHRDESLRLDFGVDPDAPMIPMRVIG